MGNLNIVVAGSKDYAAKVGKKGTITDMTFYEIKKGNDSVTLIEPSKYPEKLSSLFYAVAMAEYAVLVVEKIDNFLGETIVMIDSLGLDKGWIVLRNYIQPEQLKPLLAGTTLENFEYIDDVDSPEKEIRTREMFIDLACNSKKVAGNGTCGSCPIDSHFNVKGVGTVILGSVTDGYFKVHDEMTIFPLKKKVILKSIQKHDIDAPDGIKGDHVGLALRGIESDELDRGFVATTDASIKMTRKVNAKANLVKFWPAEIKEGMVMHIGHWMQMVPCRVISSKNDGNFREPTLELELESDIIHKPGDKGLMMYLEGGKLRVVGSIVLE